MRFRLQPWHLAAALLLICAGTLAALYWFRAGGGVAPAQLISYLPGGGNATLMYIDVAAMRRSGLLDALSGAPAAQDPEYLNFVQQARFDYRTDLDALAVSFRGNDKFFVLRGRFDWKALMAYVDRQGGVCSAGVCRLQGSTIERNISFYPLRRNMMAFAVSPDDYAATNISGQPHGALLDVPSFSVWMRVPAAVLHSAEIIPDRARPFADALSAAQEVVLTLGPKSDNPDAGLRLSAQVTCRDASDAGVLEARLAQATEALRELLAGQHKVSSPADVTGLLTAGEFRRDGRRVLAQWPVTREFIETVAGARTD